MTEVIRYNHNLHYALNHEDNVKIRLEYWHILNVVVQARQVLEAERRKRLKHRMMQCLLIVDRIVGEYMSAEDLSMFSAVCRRWSHWQKDEVMWGRLCKYQFGVVAAEVSLKEKNNVGIIASHDLYKKLYQRFRILVENRADELSPALATSISASAVSALRN